MASVTVHFADAATGACVQRLTVSKNDWTEQQIRADLTANTPADRALFNEGAGGHVIGAGGNCSLVAAPPPDPLLAKRVRLAALRAKGWSTLTAAERDEAQALRFDLGL